MIFLTSNGLSSPSLKEKFRRQLNGDIKKCAIIPTAMEKDKQVSLWLDETKRELNEFGLECDIFYIGRDQNEKLYEYDVIYMCGGNVFYLMQKINETGIAPVIAKCAHEKIIVGVSAGSLIMQKDLVLIKDLIPRMNKHVKLKDLSSLDLTGGIEHLPHKTRYINTIDAFEKRVKTYEKKTGQKVICLEDCHGILINKEESEYIL